MKEPVQQEVIGSHGCSLNPCLFNICIYRRWYTLYQCRKCTYSCEGKGGLLL